MEVINISANIWEKYYSANMWIRPFIRRRMPSLQTIILISIIVQGRAISEIAVYLFLKVVRPLTSSSYRVSITTPQHHKRIISTTNTGWQRLQKLALHMIIVNPLKDFGAFYENPHLPHLMQNYFQYSLTDV